MSGKLAKEISVFVNSKWLACTLKPSKGRSKRH